MTPDQARDILKKVCSSMKLSMNDHKILQTAIDTLYYLDKNNNKQVTKLFNKKGTDLA